MIVVESAARINAWGAVCPNHGRRVNQFLTRVAAATSHLPLAGKSRMPRNSLCFCHHRANGRV